jgi:hypothetical protein
MKMTDDNPYPIGTKTRWGTIAAIHSLDGERYYFILGKFKMTSFLPHEIVRDSFSPKPAKILP